MPTSVHKLGYAWDRGTRYQQVTRCGLPEERKRTCLCPPTTSCLRHCRLGRGIVSICARYLGWSSSKVRRFSEGFENIPGKQRTRAERSGAGQCMSLFKVWAYTMQKRHTNVSFYLVIFGNLHDDSERRYCHEAMGGLGRRRQGVPSMRNRIAMMTHVATKIG